MRWLRIGSLGLVALVVSALASTPGDARAQDDDLAECVGLSAGAVCTSAEGEQGKCKVRDDGTEQLHCDADDPDAAATSVGTGAGGEAGDASSGTGTDDGGDVPGRACAFSAAESTSWAPAMLALAALMVARLRRWTSARA